MAACIDVSLAKVERAKKHIDEFEAKVSGLVLSNTTHPHLISVEPEPEGERLIYKLVQAPKVPHEIAAIAGDAIHNLRSSLDLLITQLVERSGKMPKDRRTPAFPTDKSREGLEARLSSKIEPLIGKDAADCIRACEPYLGGHGETVWYLHHLDIEDKHRVVYGLSLNLSSLTLALPSHGIFTAEQNDAFGKMMDGTFFRPADNMFPLKAGDVLFLGPPQPTNDPKFRLDVAFAQPEIVEAQPVLPTITQYTQSVEAIITSFAPLF